jgi:hypothetical protein
VTTPKSYQHPNKIKTHSISIYKLNIPRICFAKKLTFKKWPSCICHQVSGFAHINEEINNLLNRDNSLVTNVQKDFSIEACIPNIFYSSSNLTSSVLVIDAMILQFSCSKHTIKKRITTLALYLNVN